MTLCPVRCPMLSITEKDQDKEKRINPGKPVRIHVCMYYDKRLYHGAYHPRLIAAIDNCFLGEEV